MDSRAITLDKIRTNFSSFQELWLFVRMGFFVTVLPIMLRVLSLSTMMNILTPKNQKCSTAPEMVKIQEKIVKYTDYILNRNIWIYKQICIKRAMVLYYFLSRAGFKLHICFGVRYNTAMPEGEDKKLEGHAWLLYNDMIYLEKNVSAARTYKMTYCFPPERGQSKQADS
jgi:hypothetical protein